MKKIYLMFLGILISIAAVGQKTDAMLFGDVKAKEGGMHLPYATIIVKGTTLTTRCDATGHYKMTDVPEGKQTLVARLDGYQEQEVEVTMERGKSQTVQFLLEKDPLELSQVVVTGTRTSHFVKDVPIRTEVLTSQSIKRKNAQNLFEALEGVPGVRVEQQCQACNFSEVRMQGLGAEHTQVLIDGEPVYSGLAGVYGLQQMGTNDIDRMEVVKGAGSALYGSSAVAGAINIISKEPSFEPSVNGDVQFGNWGYKNYKGSGSMRFRNIGLMVTAQHTEMDALDETMDGMTRKEVKNKDGVSDRVSSRINNVGMSVYFFNPFAKNDKLVFRAKAMDELRSGGTMTNDLYLNPYSEGTENIQTNRLSLDMAYTLPIGAHSELNVSTAYVHHKRNATNDTFLGNYKDSHDGNSPDVELMRPYLAKENTLTPSLTFTSILGNHTLLAGVQGYFTRLRETGMYVLSDDDYKTNPYYGIPYTSIGKKRATEFGFFIQDEWNVTPKLTVVPGLRLDNHSSSEEYDSSEKVFDGNFPKTKFDKTSFNPRLAIKYEVSPSLIMRANIGTGFRAPYGFSEDLHLCSGSPRVWKSSNLKGERSISYNLSADYYGKGYQLSLNIFRTDLKDKIQFSPASDEVTKLGYTYEWQNVDDAYVQGIEIGAKATPFKNFNASLNWTFNSGKFKHIREDWKNTIYAEDSKNVSRFPAMTGDLTLEYSPGTWNFSLTGSLQGKMYIDYNAEENAELSKIKKTETFTLWNCRIAKKFGSVSVYAGGKNIFSYIQNEKHTDDAAFMYAPVYGATWYAGVSVTL
ncbi:MAG: TonB-dependent receptor [Prevotella sp.]|uniref:TonB-dependent receptor n=1 Tax=Prevotella sp. TaxID=59823 RepID=UPI002A2DB427|nr:TonB-dependent receptor [Prevotella sp.]MDD7317199.1 TonB-dependent receptor [Prevotellaceae bacterium]MDY4019803.1 TonB-dependent receptor [Prevotella sp.]